ncbi:hypothetical protein GF324_00175 [bacterium]|nr:hypothetical protein [bacterium]
MNPTDRTRRVKDILWALAFPGAVAMVFRFAFGLGATTNLTDGVPWGLWKIFNMVAGAALATSGFTVGFLGHVLHLKRFRPLVKPAIVVAFLGYGSSLFALLFDIGLPWRFWHPFVYWNHHSFLFEVFWCVSFYFLITFLELSPTLLERLGLEKLRGTLHKAGGVFVIIGITLSSLHHTSLGSLFLVTPQRLHELWFSPIVSLLFIVSAIGGGMMVLLLAKVLYARWYDPDKLFYPRTASGELCETCVNPDENGKGLPEPPHRPQIRALATASAMVLGVYFLLKLGDLLLRPDAWSALLAGTWESWLYGVELLLGVALPVVLVSIKRVRYSTGGLTTAAVFAAGGLALNRMNVGIFGYFRGAEEVYFPSGLEWAITVGVLAMAGLAWFFLVENFTVFDERWKVRASASPRLLSSFDRLTYLWNHRLLNGMERITLIGLVVVPVAWILLYSPYYRDKGEEVFPPLARDVERDTLLLDGNRFNMATTFAHAAHQQRLGGRESCSECHHLTLPADQATPCNQCHTRMEGRTAIFDHARHAEHVARDKRLTGLVPANLSCTECHGEDAAKARSTAKGCLKCHEEDMHPVDPPAARLALEQASGYRSAMHGTCIPCHKQKAVEVDNPHLGDCATCHPGRTAPGEDLVRAVVVNSEDLAAVH